ncbi:MAG: YihY/virulence factor BrkB family protein [Bacteroidetes bacterium]|nr:YihY/virulence factor BrkB family protein [Bacteroidota bacterium]MBU1484726.1 YihY/virulence factor BrkB family protein [Bacteroidota bacterium]MBU2267291.1 YihY/virulence factor BrkB family protein [Bacteroidota bacterium]MBU2376853.1 YihY/virulence factor BrkB family protein [Bacteroidota bacterium]
MHRITDYKFYTKILKEAFNAFIDDKGLKLSASLAYYTIFSLAPMLIVLLSVGGIFYGHDALQGKIFRELNDFIGNDAAMQIETTIKKLALSGKSNVAIITGIVTLLIGASGVFVEIQDSINEIWRVKAVPKKGWLKLIVNRMISLSMVASLGFLLIVSLMINSIVLAFSTELARILPEFIMVFFDAINFIITFLVLMSLFAIIYKVLPDVEIEWKNVKAGSFFTAVLFMLGKYLIGFYIALAGIGSIYGAAGTIIIIAVWVYYSAAILFFGAEFTWSYAKVKGLHIRPSKYAVSVKKIEVEQGKKPVDLS